MKEKPTTVDEYLLTIPEFARPVLEHFRKLVHQVCPEAEEILKWGHPSFNYKGILCGFAGFKKYCAIVFWKGALIGDSEQVLKQVGSSDMKRLDALHSVKDLPSDKVLKAWLKEAVRLNEENIKVPATSRKEKKELVIPADLQQALKKNKAAYAVFEQFSTSNKRDYAEWLEEAKTQATRDKRLATAVEWIAEGKVRNWKYVKK